MATYRENLLESHSLPREPFEALYDFFAEFDIVVVNERISANDGHCCFKVMKAMKAFQD